jgi:nicotinate-nucleotide pyrophosphorylase (carboxylating)
MIKDNHLAGLSIAEAVERGRHRWPGRLVEVECESLAQVMEALEAGATMVMLDNMSPDDVAECAKAVDGAIPIEVSGRITLEEVARYAEIDGVTYVSVGAITHSAPSLDIGLDIQEG